MFFLSFKALQKENKKLHKVLGIEEGEVVDLKYHDGFFFCPSDKKNRTAQLSSAAIFLPETVTQILWDNDPVLFRRLVNGRSALYPTSTLPLDDIEEFTREMAVIYLLAAVSYLEKKERKYEKISHLFKKNPHKDIILRGFGEWVRLYVKNHGLSHNQMDFYSKAKEQLNHLAKTKSQRLDLSYDEFLVKVSLDYNLIGHVVGAMLEKGLENIGKMLKTKPEKDDLEFFRKIIKRHETRFSDLCTSVTRQPGVLISLDGEESVKKEMAKKASGLGHPDFIFVTKKFIFPIDAKLNLNTAKTRQISKDNLREVFSKVPKIYQTIFNNIMVEGKLVETPKEEAKDKAAKKKANTPMDVLKNMPKTMERKYLGAIAKLWNKSSPITQEELKAIGVKGDLAKIVQIFNGMLKK